MLTTMPAHHSMLLGGARDDVALVTESGALSYGELAERVIERRRELGATRRLVMLQASNDLEPLVTYLAALEDRHPILLVAPGEDEASIRHRAHLAERFDPDVIAAGAGNGPILHEVRVGSAHRFSPDLALLVSTSGSTGSPKLVRLSHENLVSNARAIADYLRLGPADRAATTLPMHYCYGLSVINSHLISGAGIMLTGRSVTDAAFWEEASAHRITSFAGVPYTFELLEAGGFAERLPTSIRYLTQAGGRLAPEAIRRFARLGDRRGFEFFVMYGQTEATARMAYVPAELAEQAAGAIGRPIPGGRLRIDAEPGAEIGELVYEGPNVMLGYAESPADFALGRTVHELRTGDLAKQRPDGLFEVVGRMNRFVKVFGLRVDLDAVQRLLEEDGIVARTSSAGERLLVFVREERRVDEARSRAAALLGIPAHAVRAYAISEFPCTSSGKPDFRALVSYAALLDERIDDPAATTAAASVAESIRDVFVELLGRADATVDDSFAGLGGDSLSYVEVSLRLEDLLGRLPREWPSLPGTRLAAAVETSDRPAPPVDSSVASAGAAASDRQRTAARRKPMLPRMETPAVLRAIAIVLIVATHADLIGMKGGAHLLLAVAGYNLARFQLADVPGAARVRRLLRSAAQIAIPAVIWIGAVAVISGKYTWPTALLVNNVVPGDGAWNEQWQFWFLEAAVWSMLGLALLFAIRPIDRLERRHPWAFAVVLLAATLALRFAATGIEAQRVDRYTAVIVLWCLVLGWVIARADTMWRRAIASAAVVVATFGFFGEPAREAVVVVGLLLLIWAPQLRLPRPLVPVIRLLAGASLFIYLTHWVVYPAWEASAPLIGTVLSLLVGIGAWFAYRAIGSSVAPLLGRARDRVRGARSAGAARSPRSTRAQGASADRTGSEAAVSG
ncbi:AMP-binding protein [Agromyces cerinus]|uniref:Acyl-CoA synthetase (AMP-forming)/AMP-acid ligase II n=1 Tax=Agromyces cerinus subsp. cerinus TaxID=232089 RepID=A0A1N6HJY9_9MICO|nr:AMP-binding protein [Agromyces cerinus]SIO20043.1 Acyl-CoA synthetase (AMP-forming)/AMP-acid ligase II [Agromyces cerinus subsp. cerinus]